MSRDKVVTTLVGAVLVLGFNAFIFGDDIRERLSAEAQPQDGPSQAAPSDDELSASGALSLVKNSEPYRQDRKVGLGFPISAEDFDRLPLNCDDIVHVALGWVVRCEGGTYFVSESDGTVTRRTSTPLFTPTPPPTPTPSTWLTPRPAPSTWPTSRPTPESTWPTPLADFRRCRTWRATPTRRFEAKLR